MLQAKKELCSCVELLLLLYSILAIKGQCHVHTVGNRERMRVSLRRSCVRLLLFSENPFCDLIASVMCLLQTIRKV